MRHLEDLEASHDLGGVVNLLEVGDVALPHALVLDIGKVTLWE